MQSRALTKAALLPAALLMAVGGSGAALAGTAAPAAHAGSGASVTADQSYTMQLSSPSATIRAGGATRTVVSFDASDGLYGTPVNLSVSGLPRGVRASFSPSTTTIGGNSVLTLTSSRHSASGAFTITVTAITESSDPIGTSAPFGLTIRTR
jgi:hypothetical protein